MFSDRRPCVYACVHASWHASSYRDILETNDQNFTNLCYDVVEATDELFRC